jgi:hypothetical protein
MSEEAKKKVDQDWKERAEKEKQKAQVESQKYYEPTFTIFLNSLILQAMVYLGKLESPVTGKPQINLEQARFMIDTLGIVKEKTKGNLTPDEEKLLEEALFSLRMLYIDADKKTGGEKEKPDEEKNG